MSSEPLYSHLNSRGQLPSAMQVRTRRFLSRWTWVWGGSILKYGGTSSTGEEEGDRKKDVMPGWKRADAQQPNSPEMWIPNKLLHRLGIFLIIFLKFPSTYWGVEGQQRSLPKSTKQGQVVPPTAAHSYSIWKTQLDRRRSDWCSRGSVNEHFHTCRSVEEDDEKREGEWREGARGNIDRN